MDETYEPKGVFFCGAGAVLARLEPRFYAVADMPHPRHLHLYPHFPMAAAKIAGETPEEAGMEQVGKGIYCPFAGRPQRQHLRCHRQTTRIY